MCHITARELTLPKKPTLKTFSLKSSKAPFTGQVITLITLYSSARVDRRPNAVRYKREWQKTPNKPKRPLTDSWDLASVWLPEPGLDTFSFTTWFSMVTACSALARTWSRTDTQAYNHNQQGNHGSWLGYVYSRITATYSKRRYDDSYNDEKRLWSFYMFIIFLLLFLSPFSLNRSVFLSRWFNTAGVYSVNTPFPTQTPSSFNPTLWGI